MRFILFSIILAAIVVGTTYYVGPEMNSFHEGRLKNKTIEALNNEGYQDIQVKMNHLHAEKIVVTKIANEKTSRDKQRAYEKDRVAHIVRKVYGAYADRENVVVHFINPPIPPTTPTSPPVKNPKSPDSTAKVNPPKPKPEPPKPKPEPPKPVLQPAEISVEWDTKKTRILVSGKLADLTKKDAFISQLETSLNNKVVNDTIAIHADKVAKNKSFSPLMAVIPEIIKSSEGKGSLKLSDPAGDLKIGTMTVTALFFNKQAASTIAEKITATAKGKYQFDNRFTYHPEFSIIKDDKKRIVFLRGYADQLDCIDLESNVKRYTIVKANNYSFKSEIIQDGRSTEYNLSNTDQDRLANHLARIARGEIHYNNKGISAISGVTNDPEYHRELEAAYGDSEVKNEMKFDPNVKLDPQNHIKPREDDATAKAAKAALLLKQQEKLRGKLKPVKVYFGSGQKSVDAKYEAMIKQAAQDILASPDKKSIIVIGGFADHTGNAEMNKRLSKDRARSVQAKLIAHGIPASRTTAEFFGAEKASADKKLSRRVEIRVR